MKVTAVVAALSIAASSLGAQARPARSPDFAALDRSVAQWVRDWRSPGLAISIVKGDSVVFAKGYGVLDVGRPDKVNEHTRFAIGSTTKAMTSVGLGMLVDEGKLKWDDRVIDHLPELRLYDPYVTRELTIRDLLLHRSGLASTDMMWLRADMSQDEMMRRLRYVRPVSSFRSTWSYQNNVYAIGGAVIEKVSGMSWEAFTQQRIFAPLGMSESIALVSGIAGQPNVAKPHREVGDTVRVTAYRTTDPVASAGSVYSSASDMAKWMRFILDSGRVGSKRLLSPATFSEIVTPQIRADPRTYPALALSRPHGFSYGLGWFVQDYQGDVVWMHTGSINGMSAIVGLLPDQRVGVFVLANLDHVELRHALMYTVFDLYAGNPMRDWSGELRKLFAGEPTVAQRPSRPANAAAPSAALERYAGTYSDSAYGAVEVTFANGTLRARFGKEELGALTPWQGDTFRAVGSDPDDSPRPMVFTVDGSGNVAAVRVLGTTFVRERTGNR